MGWIFFEELAASEQWSEIPQDGRLLCGRSKFADIVFSDKVVSRNHLALQHKNGLDFVVDLESPNGTFLNGLRLHGAKELNEGDQIQVGSHVLLYQLDSAKQDDTPTDILREASNSTAADHKPLAQCASAKPSGPTETGALDFNQNGRWVDSKLIGRGGMGEVYQTYDRDLGSHVALKRLRQGNEDRRQFLERLHVREAAIGRMIDHPNVVKTLEDGLVDGSPYMLLEWVEGKTLDQYCKLRVSQAQHIELLRQIALGLDCAHRAGVVHADLKPQNLLVAESEKSAVENLSILEMQAAEPKSLTEETEDADTALSDEIIARLGPANLDFKRPAFVGREAELEVLDQLANDLKEQTQPIWLLLFGDRGAGKLRLLSHWQEQNQGILLEFQDELKAPIGKEAAIYVSLLPAEMPADPDFGAEVLKAQSQINVAEIFLKPLYSGQAARLVEAIMGDMQSARLFVESELGNSRPLPLELLRVLEKSYENGAWKRAAAGHRYQPQDQREQLRIQLKEQLRSLHAEEKGLQDLMLKLAVLGGYLHFEQIRDCLQMDSAILFYLLEHALKTEYLQRSKELGYYFKLSGLRKQLEGRVKPKEASKLVKKALPTLLKALKQGQASTSLKMNCAQHFMDLSKADAAFFWFLSSAMDYRREYMRTEFLLAIDKARECFRLAAAKKASQKEVQKHVESLLGVSSNAWSALERVRNLPIGIQLKIADFGIARRHKSNTTEDSEEQDQETEKEQAWGTPRYMSPEQASMLPLTPASDVYALGILARWMLEGRHPLAKVPRDKLIAVVRRGLLNRLPEQMQPSLKELFTRVLAPEPDLRPSAIEVAIELEKFQLANC